MRGIDKVRTAADAYENHAEACPVCNDPENKLTMCEVGSELMSRFYLVLQEVARQGG